MDGLVVAAEVRSAFARGSLILGSAQWGMPYGIANELGIPGHSDVTEILNIAAASGIRCIDTARDYGDAERVIGEILDGDDEWLVATKVSSAVCEDDLEDSEAIARLERSIEASMRALRRDVVDVVLFHRGWHRAWHDGILWTRLSELCSQGTVGACGVSAMDPGEADSAALDSDIPIVQVAYSVFDRRIAEMGAAEKLTKAGTCVACRSPLLQGAGLMQAESLPRNLRALEAVFVDLDGVAIECGLTRSQLLLVFARDTAPGAVVSGCESPAQMRENVETWTLPPLDPAILEYLSSVGDRLDVGVVDPARW